MSNAKYYGECPFFGNFSKIAYERGTTPFKLTLECGFSQGTFTRWSNGMIPSDETIQKLATVLDVKQSDLLLTKKARKKLQASQNEMLTVMSIMSKDKGISYGQLQLMLSRGEVPDDVIQSYIEKLRAARKKRKRRRVY